MAVALAALLLGAATAKPPDDEAGAAARPVSGPAASAPPDRDDVDQEEDERRLQPDSEVVVTARRLDAARTRIDAALGATVYSLTNEVVEDRPGGETGRIADILSQAPGASLSGRGLEIRSSAANQVRINNVILPEAIADPAEQLSARLAETTRLLTGALPAQFGFAPAGVISVTTKNGLYEHGGQAELFAGTDGMVEPAVEWAGSAAGTSLFLSGDLERSRIAVADAAGIAAHDRRVQIGGLGFADHVIDAENRLSLIFGGGRQRERLGAGKSANSDGYAVGSFQHSDGGFTVQASLFAGLGSDRVRFAAPTRERRGIFGTQIDATDSLGPSHIVRFGLLASRFSWREHDLGGAATRAARTSAALYAQDEWKLAPSLTFNPGARIEWLRGFARAASVEPRASLVWQPAEDFTAHLGYSRYASAPPAGETRARLPDERDDYFDAGVQKKLGSLTVGADGYWRSAHNHIAEHETPGSAVRTSFAFRRARFRGLELSAIYTDRTTSAWANLSLSGARARTVIGGETLFAPAIVAAASERYVPLAGDRPIIASGGLTRRLGRLSLSGDMLMSSGAAGTRDPLRPNGSRRSSYAVFNLAAVYHARFADRPADIRLDLTNVADAHYVTSDAASLEGGWTRQGRGKAITIGIEQGF